jgi:opacity protein-like surface antigen
MKKLFVVLVVGLLLIPLAVQSFAGIGFGPRLGYYKSQDADKGNMFGGLSARMKFGLLGAEASIDYRAEKYMNGLLTVRSWPVMASVLLYPVPIAYGIAGFGWYNVTMDYNQDKLVYGKIEDKTTQEVGWHFGGGVELPVGSSAKLTADIRYVFLNYDFQDVPGQGKQKANFYAVTVGLLFGL